MMNKLVELNSTTHKSFKVKTDCTIGYAEQLHMLNIRVTEVPKSISDFPVFISKNNHDGAWALSAISSIVPGRNMFITNGQWEALYQPASVRAFPFFLMNSPRDEKSYTVGIIEQSDAFSQDEGEPLFDASGKASLYLTEQTKLVENSVKEDIQTYQFTQKLDSMGLIKSVDLVVHYQGGTAQVLKGLFTINEDALQSLSGEQLTELNKLGYLAAIHGMLVSIYQLNGLVRRNNLVEGLDKVEQIRLEVSKDRSVA